MAVGSLVGAGFEGAGVGVGILVSVAMGVLVFEPAAAMTETVAGSGVGELSARVAPAVGVG